MIHVEIRNFQSIESLDFTIEGFTALVGKSNIGKSSIIRALKCALSGGDGTHFVRHDWTTCSRVLRKTKECKCFTSVTLKFEDGRKLIWEKGDTVNRYTVFDQQGKKEVYDKIGSSPELPELLRDEFSPVDVGKDKKLLQVSDQFYPLFLLDVAGPTVADVLSDVAQLDDINFAMRLVSKDRKAAVATRKVRESDIVELTHSLVKYEGLDSAISQVRKKQEGFANLLERNGRLQQLDDFLKSLLTTSRVVKNLLKIHTVQVPPFEVIRIKKETTARAVLLYVSLERKVQTYRSLQGIQKISTPREFPVQKVRLLERITAWQARYPQLVTHVEASKRLDSLTVPGCTLIKEKTDRLNRVRSWEAQIASLEHVTQASDVLAQASVRDSTKLKATAAQLHQVARLCERFEATLADISKTEGSLQQVTKEAEEIQAEFDALGVCPTCSQKITPLHPCN